MREHLPCWLTEWQVMTCAAEKSDVRFGNEKQKMTHPTRRLCVCFGAVVKWFATTELVINLSIGQHTK